MNNIHPIIFFSISKKANTIFDKIENGFKNINTALNKELYFRHIEFDDNNTITNSFDEGILNLPFENINNKENNFNIINSNISSYKSIFEKAMHSVNNIQSVNYAAENNSKVETTQIVFLAEIDNPILSTLVIPFLQDFNSLASSNFGNPISNLPQVHLLLLYNSSNTDVNFKKESAINKCAFLKEIESSPLEANPFIWLLDIINEKSVHLENEDNLNYSITQFVDLLFTSANEITKSTFRSIESGKSCFYSTFGYSSIVFPENKIKEYLNLYASSIEFNKLASEFKTKFELISLKDEITKFFQTHNLYNLSDKLSKDSKANDIFVPFTFDYNKFTEDEKEFSSNKSLSLVDQPDIISQINTSDFFRQVESAYKNYNENTSINFSIELDFAKKRESDKLIDILRSFQLELMDAEGKGINYALLFSSILSNNKAFVETLLDGRFSSDIPTLSSLQEHYRSNFIGEEIKDAQNELTDFTNKLSNNIKLINQYQSEKKNSEKAINSFNSVNDEINPRKAELTAKIENFDNQILFLSDENIDLNNQILNKTSFIENIKNEFDQDSTKNSYKQKRLINIFKNIDLIKEKELPQNDLQLSELYKQKNDKLIFRKKFIFNKLILLPSLIVLFSIIGNALLYFKVHNSFEYLLKGFEISLFVLFIYAIVYLYFFFKLEKNFKFLLTQVTDLINKKNNLLSNYISLLNSVCANSFEFEKDIISLNMISPFVNASLDLQNEIIEFKESILLSESYFSNNEQSFEFPNDSFQISVVSKEHIRDIYNSSYKKPIVKGDIKLSECYLNYKKTDDLSSVNSKIEYFTNDLFKRKILSETLKDIIFNNSSNFKISLTPDILFNKLINSSRPLLRTEIFNKDIPYCQDIFIGQYDELFTSHLGSINFSKSLKIDENNSNCISLLSIKSNFPSFLIYDTLDNESIFNEYVNDDNKSQYIINNNAFNYTLKPGNRVLVKDDDLELGNSLIFAITRGDIIFNQDNITFSTTAIKNLASNWEDLIKKFNSPTCKEVRSNNQLKFDEMLKIFNADDYLALANRFIDSFLNIKIPINNYIEQALSVFYFSILKGKEADWNILSTHFLDLKKKSI